MRKSVKQFVSAANMNADITSTPIGLDQDWGYAIQANFSTSGSLGGVLSLQASLDYNPGTPQSGGAFNAGNWWTVQGSPYTLTAAGTYGWDVPGTVVPYVRLVYTHLGGDTGSLNAFYSTKGY